MPTLLLTVASVPVPVTLALPSNEPLVYAKSPVIAIVRPFAKAVAVPAFPVTEPVIALEKVLSPPIVWLLDVSTKAPVPAIGITLVALPPAPPVPVP